MPIDLTLSLINATVQVDQQQTETMRFVGTGFLVDAPRPDGSPRTVLITAGHVLDGMPGQTARIGYRFQGADGAWQFAPQAVPIRGEGSRPLWVSNPEHDIAVIAIKAPPEFAKAAIPLSWLADETSFEAAGLAPGDEMFVLGFPGGKSANSQGFPILRSGRVASYPLSPTNRYPTFLLDFRVFAGNSGGPVFIESDMRRHPGAGPGDERAQFVAGMLTKQSMDSDRPLELGVVVDAAYIRQTIALLDVGQPAAEPESAQTSAKGP